MKGGAARAPAPPPPLDLAASPTPPVLVAADHPGSLQALAAVLEPLGAEVVRATSGDDALRQLLRRAFAVIVMDLRMPDLDGIETTRLLRRHPAARHTPVIFVTGQDPTELRALEAYALGAVDYIMKPVVPAVLRSKVGVFLELARRSEQIRRQAAELAELHREAEQRAAELAATNRELESFAYTVSHDLRAPLRAITGFTDIVLEDHGAKLDAEGLDSLHRIRAAASRLDRLIEGLLALAHVTRVPLQRESVDCSALARAILDELAAAEPRRTVDAVVAPGVVVEGDPALLRQVLENLLRNAWKFTGRRARARIEFGLERRGSETACFVRDDGAGFDPTAAERIFEAFGRAHPESEFPGTGIGLATVERIARRHGGRAWAEGAVDRGATFWFTVA